MDEPQKKMIGDGEGESPLMMNTDKGGGMTMRTMKSDIASMLETGGSAPRPYVPLTQPAPAPMPMPASPSQPIPQPASVSSSPVSPMASVPTPKSTPSPISPSSFQTMASNPPPTTPSSPNLSSSDLPSQKGGMGKWIIILVAIIGLGALYYYVIYPNFLAPQDEPAPAPQLNTPPVIPPPAPTPEPEVIPTSTPAQLPPPIIHTSFFKTKADIVTEVALTAPDLQSIQTAFGASPVTVPLFKELMLKQNEAQLLLKDFLALVTPGVFSESALEHFEGDYTLFTYANKDGVFPGYILKGVMASTTRDILQAATKISLEGADKVGLVNIYPANPGNPSATWKQGKTGVVVNRYLVFSTPTFATSFNYGWVGDILVVSASYDGFKEALKRL